MRKKSLLKLISIIMMLTVNVIVGAIYPIEYLNETYDYVEKRVDIEHLNDDKDMMDIVEIPVVLDLLAKILEQEDSLLEIELKDTQKVYMVGDIHGNIQALNMIDYIVSKRPNDIFIFLGDYVDRYDSGTDVFIYLATLKTKYPQRIYLLRGNHETRNINRSLGFYDEITGKYENADEIYEAFNNVFDKLPLAAVVNCKTKKLFCVHGGICPSGNLDSTLSLEQIRHLPKKDPENYNSIMNGLLWSDPINAYFFFIDNRTRGIGYRYGERAVRSFLKQNKIDYIIRAHQVAEEGIEEHFGGIVKTVFSIPKYCNIRKNLGAVLGFSSHTDMFETIKFTY